MHPEGHKHKIYLPDIKNKKIKIVPTKYLSYAGNRTYDNPEVKDYLNALLTEHFPEPTPVLDLTPVEDADTEDDILHTPTPREPDQDHKRTPPNSTTIILAKEV